MVDDGKIRTVKQLACYFSHSYPALKEIFTAQCGLSQCFFLEFFTAVIYIYIHVYFTFVIALIFTQIG